eukprot:s895_g24.t2
MPSFVPVQDPEKARCEQDEESLRKHRQFDTPFALLPKDLNNPKEKKGDLNPIARRSEELYQDENKLWKKKREVFDKQQTWGRETAIWSNPEETRDQDKRKYKPGEVFWGAKGTFGGKQEDSGLLTLQRGEVDQTMELNEKGLWVRKKKPTTEDRPGLSSSAKQLLKTSSNGEDPRLEAAKPKGRGTADASEKALEALQERRKLERKVQDEWRATDEREDPGIRPAGALRSEDSKAVPTPATNRARQIGDSLEHLLSGAQQGILGHSKLSGYRPHGGVDFDDEARKLWARLNLDPSVITGGQYNAVDPLWQHPETRAVFYVGNQTAASNLPLLQKHGITHVVNCTDNMPNYHEGNSSIRYYRFDISRFHRQVKTDADADRFVQPMLDFVSSALASGKNVMVHCLAGAHRAGTTGCICLMHFAQLDAKDAVSAAKRCRPIIEPIADFPVLLAKLERSWGRVEAGGSAVETSNQNLKAVALHRDGEKAGHGWVKGLGMTNKGKKPQHQGPITTLNSSSQQCRPSKRHAGMKRWQGVQRTDEEAKEVVEKALGSCAVGGEVPKRMEPSGGGKRNRSPSPLAVSSPSGSDGEKEDGKFEAAWMDSDDEREAAKLNQKPSGGDIVVDFF